MATRAANASFIMAFLIAMKSQPAIRNTATSGVGGDFIGGDAGAVELLASAEFSAHLGDFATKFKDSTTKRFGGDSLIRIDGVREEA